MSRHHSDPLSTGLASSVETAAEGVLAVHILAGIVALGAGFAAIVTRKGGPRHNTAGKSYVLSMAVVVVTALPLSVRVESPFLLAIAVFSGYLVFAGRRVIGRRRARLTELAGRDYLLHGTMIVAGSGMVGVGGWQSTRGEVGLAPVLVVFGAIGLLLAGRELRVSQTATENRTPWFERHIVYMSAAYIATVTATITVNLTMVPPLVRWLGPTVIGVPLIFYAIAKYQPVFGSARS